MHSLHKNFKLTLLPSALENLDTEEVESPEASRERSKSPMPETKADEA